MSQLVGTEVCIRFNVQLLLSATYLLPLRSPLLSYFHPETIQLGLDQVSTVVPSAVGGRRGRLVTQDLLNPLVELGVKLGQHVESLDVLVNLLRLGSSKLVCQLSCPMATGKMTYNTGRDVLVRDSPSKSQVAHVTSELFGNLGQFPDLLELSLALFALEELGLVGRSALDIDGESRSFGESIIVFTSKDTLLQWGPDGAIHQFDFLLFDRQQTVTDLPYPSHRQSGSYSVSKLSRCNIE